MLFPDLMALAKKLSINIEVADVTRNPIISKNIAFTKGGFSMKSEKAYIVRFIYALLGNVILAAGAAMLVHAALGSDLFTGQIRPVANLIGLSMGTYQMIFSIIFAVIIFMLRRELIGIGSIINVFLTGYFISFFINHFGPLGQIFSFGHIASIDLSIVTYSISIGQIILIFLALVVYSLGISLYSNAGLGAGPYDGIGQLIQSYTNWKFFKCRMIADAGFLILCLIFGVVTFNKLGPVDAINMPTFLVGPSTFIAALCLGPFIGFWTTKVTIPTLEKFGYTVPAFGGEE